MDKDTKKRIQKAVVDYRAKRKWSLREASLASGINICTLSNIERGNSITVGTLKKLCAWLNVSADVLLGLKEKGE
jgi:transcriptional regulator with XRE-family HTH domain